MTAYAAVPLPPLPSVALGLVLATLPMVLAAVATRRRPRRRSRRRLRRMFATHRVHVASQSGRRRRRAERDPRRWAALAGGLAIAVVLGGWYGIAAGVVAAVALDRGLRRLEPGAARRARLVAAADLPFAVDLLAASLRAGSPPAVAARAVGDALGGPLGERFCRVAYSLGVGAAAGDAWAHLQGVPGAGRLTTAAVRSSESGAALAAGLTRLADELRAARTVACEAAARRAGVLVVLPLGLCFLPAFVLAGLVPIVLSVLGEVMPG